MKARLRESSISVRYKERQGADMDVKQVSVFLENRPGALLEFTKILKENDINMRALCLAEVSEYGVLRLIVDDVYELSQVLKDEDYIFNVTPVLAITIEDKPGSLVSILEALEKDDINVAYTYAFTSNKVGEAYIIIKCDDVEKGTESLKKAGVKLLSSEDIQEL